MINLIERLRDTAVIRAADIHEAADRIAVLEAEVETHKAHVLRLLSPTAVAASETPDPVVKTPQPDQLGAEWMRREVHGRIAKALAGSCRCGIKSNDADWHLDACPYKTLSQVDGMVECIPSPTPVDLLAAALEVPEVARIWHSLVTWDAAFRTGKNEPLEVAFELGKAALIALKDAREAALKGGK